MTNIKNNNWYRNLKNRIVKLESKVVHWTKMNPRYVRKEIDGIKTTLNKLNRKMLKAELREKQFIILLKKVLDTYNRRNKSRLTTIDDIVEYMNELIIEHDEEELTLFKDIPALDTDEMIGISEDINVKEVDIDEEKT